MDHKIRKNKQSYTIYDIYNNYNKRDLLNYTNFKNIIDRLCDNILYLLYKGESFRLPQGLGFVQIVKYKPKEYNNKSLSIDYKSSMDLNK